MADSNNVSTATEYLCLSEGTNKVCMGWNGCDASILICIDNYTVTLGPTNQIAINGSIIGTVNVNTTMTISPVQARRFAEWILANIPKDPKDKCRP